MCILMGILKYFDNLYVVDCKKKKKNEVYIAPKAIAVFKRMGMHMPSLLVTDNVF